MVLNCDFSRVTFLGKKTKVQTSDSPLLLAAMEKTEHSENILFEQLA
jgi:hypothetical protein